MSITPVDDGAENSSDDGDEPEVPEGVLEGIDDIEDGNTVSKADLESLLKF